MAGSMTRKDIRFSVLKSERGYKKICWNSFIIMCFMNKRFRFWECKMSIAPGCEELSNQSRDKIEFIVPHMTAWKDAFVRDRLAELCNEKPQDIIRYTFDTLSQR